MASPEESTSTTLLRRVADATDDPEAWERFVQRYGTMTFRWCRAWGLQPADAEDVTQTVMLQLARQMKGFRYDPSGRFRAWLRTVVRRAWARSLELRQRPGQGHGGESATQILASVPARDDFFRRFEEESDRETLELAAARVRARVQPHTWEAFRLLAVEGLSGAEVAQQLGIEVGTAYVARSKVARMIREEVAKELPPGDEA